MKVEGIIFSIGPLVFFVEHTAIMCCCRNKHMYWVRQKK